MAYVYRHIRLDKNQPFYIGKAVDNGYYRAYATQHRNSIWRGIVANTDYEVEILMSGLTCEAAIEKEKEFISLYGRIEKGGILSNQTDGGKGGNLGGIVSEKTRQLQREISKSKIITKETREKMAAKLRGRPQPQWQKDIFKKAAIKRSLNKKEGDYRARPVIQYTKDINFIKEFSSMREAAKQLNLHGANIRKCAVGDRKHTGGFKWRFKLW